MIPIRDRMPTRRFPIVTVVLVLINVVVFGLQLLTLGSEGQEGLNQMIYDFGIVPARIEAGIMAPGLMTLLTSMFLHGSVMHIGSNMLYLWIFGDNVEDVMGPLWYLLFYLVAGIAAGLAQVILSPGSNVPVIGASGAIAGVLGAYLLFYPRARVDTLVILGYFISRRRIPAIIVLGLWFVLQLFNGVAAIGGGEAGGVAWFAHIGGFVAGMALGLPWVRRARSMGIRPPRSRWY